MFWNRAQEALPENRADDECFVTAEGVYVSGRRLAVVCGGQHAVIVSEILMTLCSVTAALRDTTWK
ncbi:hypothetical protein SAMN05443245_1676 [Paraburkholderia fungorum]|uniref:Uncharacterized protein n=1 Tax=Paraburkholderia fungorum TaxID=134537 RepID=A0A1H1BIB0_9BURK|nr:hypothetical protein SAMN05443245_1676 [Paraburkholderia fungorum]